MNKVVVNGKEILTSREATKMYIEICSLLSTYGYVFSKKAIEKLITIWAENKIELIEKFKAHPNYVEGKFLNVFDRDFTRTANPNLIYDIMDNFSDLVYYYAESFIPEELKNDIYSEAHGRTFSYGSAIRRTINLFRGYSQQFIDDSLEERIANYYPQLKIKAGQKTSRAAMKMLKYFGIDTYATNFNQRFAQYSDAINPLTYKRHTVVSINPLDYLTMAFGNTWSSCHTIDVNNVKNMPNSYRGQYSSGTISYMLDGSSIVTYTVDRKYEGTDFEKQDKILRQMFHYQNEKLIQGRLYPQDNDNGADAIYTTLRNTMQELISTMFNFTNAWHLKNGIYECERYSTSSGTHYKDYLNYDNCNISLLKDSENNERISIGHNPIDIETGEEHDTAGRLNQDKVPGKFRCKNCGDTSPLEEMVIIDGAPYCKHCLSVCDICGEYTITNTHVGAMRVCKKCVSEKTVLCTECNTHVLKDEAFVDDNGKAVCTHCVSIGKVTMVNGRFVNKQLIRKCDICGERHFIESITEIDFVKYCPTCLSSKE